MRSTACRDVPILAAPRTLVSKAAMSDRTLSLRQPTGITVVAADPDSESDFLDAFDMALALTKEGGYAPAEDRMVMEDVYTLMVGGMFFIARAVSDGRD